MSYNRDEYENPKDRAFVEEMQRFEQSNKERLANEDFEEYMERKMRNDDLDQDAYEIDMPEDGEGYDDGDYNNVDYEDYNQGY